MSDDPQTKSPDQIREDIEQTRAELGDTVEALGAKTDVKGRAQGKVEEVKTNVKENTQAKVEELKDKVGGGGSGEAGSASGAQQQAEAVAAQVQENPAPWLVGAALVLGYLIGRRRSR